MSCKLFLKKLRHRVLQIWINAIIKNAYTLGLIGHILRSNHLFFNLMFIIFLVTSFFLTKGQAIVLVNPQLEQHQLQPQQQETSNKVRVDSTFVVTIGAEVMFLGNNNKLSLINNILYFKYLYYSLQIFKWRNIVFLFK